MSASGRVPAVSVVMPVYNEAAFVGAAVESVLRQTMTDFELVIVDNGSTDESPAILRRITDPRVRIFRNERNLGSASASNRVVRESRAALIARMDADDVALPRRLELQLAAFAARPDLALLGGQARHVVARGPLLRVIAPRAVTAAGIGWQSLFSSPFIHSTVMFTRESFEAAGGYDERMQRSSDFALFSRMQANGAVANLAEELVRFLHAPRALLMDPAYDDLIRAVIEQNAERVLRPHSADATLRRMIGEWPDVCLMMRGARPHGRSFDRLQLPEYVRTFAARARALADDDASRGEIERDANFTLCANAWVALWRGEHGAAVLSRERLKRSPFFAVGFVVRELADAAFRRIATARR